MYAVVMLGSRCSYCCSLLTEMLPQLMRELLQSQLSLLLELVQSHVCCGDAGQQPLQPLQLALPSNADAANRAPLLL